MPFDNGDDRGRFALSIGDQSSMQGWQPSTRPPFSGRGVGPRMALQRSVVNNYRHLRSLSSCRIYTREYCALTTLQLYYDRDLSIVLSIVCRS